MKYLIATEVDSQSDYSEADYAVLEVDQELIDRLKRYLEIVKRTPEISSASFDADFTITKSDLNDLVPGLVKGSYHCFPTDIDLSDEALDTLDLERYECHKLVIWKNTDILTFKAYEKYNSEEVWFELSIKDIEDAVNGTAKDE